ncbi:LysR family transcriptional regulator [Paraburkholderia caballeronis]|uniref:LysR family transcriptional regulator n=1 Tax=Paraburkholderia caballeronis TaxID=416943 RepID=UPI0010656952|nr:LysR family transcriptional regulator [Paraburkholderia caballeronis]TDV16639.1 LysR family transcriptional regulator [Paraburkholderia caballeronis]TDV19035.1 LysR family transcriptional regulator [Paraburkholderia caballeronis]TDV27168.1 LysR family transcriptional regulator [Paraburkholderia caballeronis]
MDKLQAMTAFVRVVEGRSFSKAAETMSLPRSSVTTTIKSLERHLGTVLLRRSTRTLSLTDAGARYYELCRAVLDDIARVEGDLLADPAAPKGRVRVDMPGAIGRARVLPRLREFEQRFPGIELVLGLSDRPADLIYDGIDCVIRTGELTDSTLVARPLGQLRWLTCAAPRYLKEHGEPKHVDDLAAHRVVNYIANATGRPMSWRFSVDGEERSLTMPSRFSINETDAYLQCGLEGLGLIQLSELVASPYLETGRLKEVLANARCAPVPISIVYPDGRNASAAVKTFVDWIVEVFRPAPAVAATR